MVASKTRDKARGLRSANAMNPRAASVTDPAFGSHPFFDPRDLVQVKYEMLRRAQVEGESITHTAASFGFSRPVFYAAQTALAQGGLPALVPQRPGPRRRHKVRPEILRFLQQQRLDEPAIGLRDLAERVESRFGVRLHPRTIERAVGPGHGFRTRSRAGGTLRRSMMVFQLLDEQDFNPARHVEKILGRIADGDVTVACWEPGQISPYHAHPHATEIYFCFQGGGVMRTPTQTVTLGPGGFVVHPPDELHEYENGSERTLLFRVRYGADMAGRTIDWRGHPDWRGGS